MKDYTIETKITNSLKLRNKYTSIRKRKESYLERIERENAEKRHLLHNEIIKERGEDKEKIKKWNFLWRDLMRIDKYKYMTKAELKREWNKRKYDSIAIVLYLQELINES